jgi:hypothetical protein
MECCVVRMLVQPTEPTRDPDSEFLRHAMSINRTIVREHN